MAIKIVITGPESTGKSVLTNQLANHFNGGLIPEYARYYITNLNRQYTYEDLEVIARKQVKDMDNFIVLNRNDIVFADTYLIITKVWFEVVFNKVPLWVHQKLVSSKIDLFLLCKPDLPWVKDDVRENGGEMRNWLYEEYETNLNYYNFNYRIVEGKGLSRLNCALRHVESLISGLTP